MKNYINNKLLNIDFTKNGCITKRRGWKTFKGMVYQLSLINKRYKKFGIIGDFTIRLPLK